MQKLSYKVIMTHLLEGGKVGPKEKSFRGFYIDFDDDGKKAYIFYNNYGSSAVKVSYDCLKWLIDEIFDGLDSLELKPSDYFVYA